MTFLGFLVFNLEMWYCWT